MTKSAYTLAIFLTALFLPPAYAGFDEAAAAFAAGNDATAIKTLRPLAEQGDARSQYAIGS